MSENTAVAKRENKNDRPARLTADMERMDALAREAQAMASASIVPKEYQGNPGNCLLAIDVARRTGVPVLTVTQNLYIIGSRPSWSSKFLIGAVNNCGRFTPMRFEVEGEESQPGWRCRAVATSKEDGELLEGPWVTWEMAEAEGWTKKSGSKWKTMPELMIRYRAAAFWSRLYAPDISLGLMTSEEVSDIGPGPKARAREVGARLEAAANGEVEDADVVDAPTDSEVARLKALMEKAAEAGVLPFEDAEGMEVAIHDENGPAVRKAIADCQKALAKASEAANGELPLDEEG